MDSAILKGKWKQLKGSVKEHWGELTEDDMQKIDGNMDQLVGTIQETYGRTKGEVEREVEAWLEEKESEEKQIENNQ